MTLQQKKVKKFEEALDEFRQYRKTMERQLEKGRINRSQFDELVHKKAVELDL